MKTLGLKRIGAAKFNEIERHLRKSRDVSLEQKRLAETGISASMIDKHLRPLGAEMLTDENAHVLHGNGDFTSDTARGLFIDQLTRITSGHAERAGRVTEKDGFVFKGIDFFALIKQKIGTKFGVTISIAIRKPKTPGKTVRKTLK